MKLILNLKTNRIYIKTIYNTECNKITIYYKLLLQLRTNIIITTDKYQSYLCVLICIFFLFV